MTYQNSGVSAEVRKIAVDQQSGLGFTSMADNIEHRKDTTYNKSTDVIDHGTFFDPSDFDPLTYKYMSLDEIDEVRERNSIIITSMILNYDESLGTNENLKWLVLAQVNIIDKMSPELSKRVAALGGLMSRRDMLMKIYLAAVECVLTLHQNGWHFEPGELTL